MNEPETTPPSHVSTDAESCSSSQDGSSSSSSSSSLVKINHETIDNNGKIEDKSLGLHNKPQRILPKLVHELHSNARKQHNKAWKKIPTKVGGRVKISPLPKPTERPSWKRPVCTFLNYMGTREETEASLDIVLEKRGTKPERILLPTSQPTPIPSLPITFFPICPCKLQHQVLKGSVETAPPILELLSSTSICHDTSPPPSETADHCWSVTNVEINSDEPTQDLEFNFYDNF